jgi:hypothetical protein
MQTRRIRTHLPQYSSESALTLHVSCGAEFMDKDRYFIFLILSQKEDDAVFVESEVSPLVSYTEEGLKQLVDIIKLKSPIHLKQDKLGESFESNSVKTGQNGKLKLLFFILIPFGESDLIVC